MPWIDEDDVVPKLVQKLIRVLLVEVDDGGLISHDGMQIALPSVQHVAQ